ncbi:hypothetical protein [Gallaecimonas sp. GXIMD4217]|uniref:WD40 repeat domain-containing protein n=1 Tax=Gallaecimonas sp. GXIMD4217 TaxID=3131927 RepID=UPI00311B0648
MRILFISLLTSVLTACQPAPEPLARWALTGNGAYDGDFSQDGRLAAISGDPEGIVVWDLDRAAPLYRLVMNPRELSASDLERDGWTPDERLPAMGLPVVHVKLSENGDYLVTADQNRLALWRTSDGQNLGYWHTGERTGAPRVDEPDTSQDRSIRDVAVSNGGNFIAYGRADGVVVHINLGTGRRLEFLGHSEKINAIAMSANGRYLLSGGNDYRALLWDSQSGQVLRRFDFPNRVTQVALSSDGRFGFAADAMHNANIYDLATGERVSALQTNDRQDTFSVARFSPDNSYLATGGMGRALTLWRLADGSQLSRQRVGVAGKVVPRSAVVYGIGFANDRLYTLSSAGLLEAWPLEAR